MATSGTTAFDMDFTEIAEEAWERAGREMRSGYDLRTARRSMNLMTIEWQNRGINMWTIDSGTVTLVSGTSRYDLPADTVDLLEHVVRTDSGSTTKQADLTISRMPDKSGYIFAYWRIRRVEDAGSGVETSDMTFRFLPCLVAGLAYHIAMKVPELVDRVQMLKAAYEEEFNRAASEDREKTSAIFVPRIGSI